MVAESRADCEDGIVVRRWKGFGVDVFLRA
jgi:hypothetical protein